MYFTLKNSTLKILKLFGLFQLFRIKNIDKIPILCYHGVSINDEHEFMPSNYMRFETFKSRILFLKRMGYRIISLQESLEMVRNKNIEKNCIVITIDDGFTPIFDELVPFLIDQNLPATIYVTSYKSKYEVPIFRLVAQYLFWKSEKNIELEKIDIEKADGTKLELKKMRTEEELWEFITLCEQTCKRKERFRILHSLASEFNLELTPSIIKAHSIANKETLTKFGQHKNINLQLHTHSHKTKLTALGFKKDIIKNIEYLEQTVSHPLVHFCYPSGHWEEEMIPILKELNIQSATTCDLGLMDKQTDPYKIPRIIDSESISEIVFYAEIVGLSSWLRNLLNK